MSADNTLRNEDQPQEQTSPEQLTNIRAEERATMGGLGAESVEIPISGHESRPGPDNTYDEIHTTHYTLDPDYTPFNQDKFIKRSHTGRFIHEGDALGYCNHMLHGLFFGNQPTSVKGGVDGQIHGDSVTCSHCQNAQITLFLVLALLGGGVLYGVFKGLY